MLFRNIGEVDVKLAKETRRIRWGLRSLSPLRNAAKLYISPSEAVIYSNLPDFLSQDFKFWLGLKSVVSLQAWAHQAASM